MRKIIIPLLASTIMGAFVLSCNKETNPAAEPDLEEAQPVKPVKDPKTIKDLLFSGVLNKKGTTTWENKKSNHTIWLVPYEEIEKVPVFRYHVMEKDKQGNILAENEIVSPKKISAAFELFSLSPVKNSVLFYDVSFTNDQLSQKAKLVPKIDGKGLSLGSPLYREQNCQAGTQVCIDWYWTVYNAETGEIISETYLYTSCYDACTGGGGGGPVNPVEDNCSLAEAQATGEAALAAGSPTSEPLGVTTISPESVDPNGVLTRTRKYDWAFYTGYFLWYTWKFISHEIGIHEKIDGFWKWKLLTHDNNITKEGTCPGESTCTLNRLPLITYSNNLQYAGIELDYTIRLVIKCAGITLFDGNEPDLYSINHFDVNS